MTIAFEIKPNEEQLAEAISLFEFIGGNTSDAVRVAINQAGPKVKTLSSTKIREEVRLSASYVRDRLEFSKASRGNLTGAIRTPSRGLLLTRFSTDPLIAGEKVTWLKPPLTPKGGIRVKVKPNLPPKVVQADGSKPFYIVLKGGNLGIATRIGRTIDVKYGPSLSQVFANIKDQALPEAIAIYQDELLQAMNYLLKKQYPPEA